MLFVHSFHTILKENATIVFFLLRNICNKFDTSYFLLLYVFTHFTQNLIMAKTYLHSIINTIGVKIIIPTVESLNFNP